MATRKISSLGKLEFLKSKGGIATLIPLDDLDIYVVNVHLDAFDLSVRVK